MLCINLGAQLRFWTLNIIEQSLDEVLQVLNTSV